MNTKSIALIFAAGALVLGGCHSMSETMSSMTKNPLARLHNAPPDELNDSPLVVDGAMQLRDWRRADAAYANGDTPAGPTGFLYEPAWNQRPYNYPLLETPLFIGQTLLLPVTLAITPPWTEVRYTGATIGTTYTAMPALPGTSEVPEPMMKPATMP